MNIDILTNKEGKEYPVKNEYKPKEQPKQQPKEEHKDDLPY